MKRQTQMTAFDFFNDCLSNVGKSGIEFQDYLFCKHVSGITFPDMAELQPLGSTSLKSITKLEADDDEESVTTFDDYLKNRENKAKNKLKKRPKNRSGVATRMNDDDDDNDD